MRILFVNPRYDETQYRYRVNKLCPPLGMAYLARILLQAGHTVSILDMEAVRMEWDELPAYLRAAPPDLIGIHGTTPIADCIATCVRIVRENSPRSIIVVGGPHATLLPESVLTDMPQVDYILRGEAEESLPLLVMRLERDGKVTDADEIQGIGFRTSGGFSISPAIPRTQDLDALPLPAYDLLPMDAYFEAGTEGRVFTMMSSRGCPHSCVFCCEPVLYGHKYRARSARNLVNEMKVLTRDYGVKHIIFYDASFMVNAGRVNDFCRVVVDEGVDVTWRARIRPDEISESLAENVKKAGCVTLSVGVESGSQRILDLMNKHCTLSQIERAYDIIKGAGLWSTGYFVFGSPGETRKEANETIEFAKKLDPDWALFSIATPLPGTALLEMARDSLVTHDWSRFRFTANSPVVSYPGLSQRDLSEIVDTAYRAFYLREEWLSNRLKKIHSEEKMRRVIHSFFFYVDKAVSTAATA